MDIGSLSFPVLLIIFIIAAIIIWIAGTRLSIVTDTLSQHFGLGEALGGIIVLAIVTNLPEIAIVVSASVKNNIELAVGNILGGIAIQTVVIVILDVFGMKGKGPITTRSSSLVLILEATMVLAVLSLVVVGHEVPASLSFFRITPAGLLIFIFWIIGIRIISNSRKTLPEIQSKNKEAKREDSKKKDVSTTDKSNNTNKTIFVFLLCAIATLIAGIALEVSSDAIAKHIGMQGVIFGATVLAAVTSLPEVSTGLAAVKLKDYEMAISDIFGGNAFLPVLFLVASLCSSKGATALPKAHSSDIYLTGLAMLLTAVYIFGLIIGSTKQVMRMGIDSFTVLIVYILGIVGLFFIA